MYLDKCHRVQLVYNEIKVGYDDAYLILLPFNRTNLWNNCITCKYSTTTVGHRNNKAVTFVSTESNLSVFCKYKHDGCNTLQKHWD